MIWQYVAHEAAGGRYRPAACSARCPASLIEHGGMVLQYEYDVRFMGSINCGYDQLIQIFKFRGTPTEMKKLGANFERSTFPNFRRTKLAGSYAPLLEKMLDYEDRPSAFECYEILSALKSNTANATAINSH